MPRFFIITETMLKTFLSIYFLSFFGMRNASAQENQLEFSFGFKHFDYTEYSQTNTILNNESGWLPGIIAEYTFNLSPTQSLDFGFSNFNSTVDYRGLSAGGTEFDTVSDAHIYSINTIFVTRVNSTTKVEAGLSHNTWQRNIRDTASISGLYEVYQWWTADAGIEKSLWTKNVNTLYAGINFYYILNPEIDVDLSRINAGNTTLDISSRPGITLDIKWTRSVNNRASTYLIAEYEYYEFGRSNTNSTSGPVILNVTEPRSVTKKATLLFGMNYRI